MLKWTLGNVCLLELWLSQGIYLVVGLLDCVVDWFLIFEGISFLFSTLALSVFIPNNNFGELPFLHTVSFQNSVTFIPLSTLTHSWSPRDSVPWPQWDKCSPNICWWSSPATAASPCPAHVKGCGSLHITLDRLEKNSHLLESWKRIAMFIFH